MTVVDRYRCWNLRALPFCSTRYICEVNVKMPLLSWTDGLPHSFSPPIRSQKSHVSDDICSDSSAGVFHSEPGLKTSLQRVCGAALCSEVCYVFGFCWGVHGRRIAFPYICKRWWIFRCAGLVKAVVTGDWVLKTVGWWIQAQTFVVFNGPNSQKVIRRPL